MDLKKAKRRFTEIANKTGIHGENLKQEPNMQERDELWDITRVFLNRIYILDEIDNLSEEEVKEYNDLCYWSISALHWNDSLENYTFDNGRHRRDTILLALCLYVRLDKDYKLYEKIKENFVIPHAFGSVLLWVFHDMTIGKTQDIYFNNYDIEFIEEANKQREAFFIKHGYYNREDKELEQDKIEKIALEIYTTLNQKGDKNLPQFLLKYIRNDKGLLAEDLEKNTKYLESILSSSKTIKSQGKDTTKFFEKANETLEQPAILQEISGDAQLEKIKKILNDDSSQINAKDSRQGMEGYTALHYACWDAKTDIAKYLIEQGADVHVKGTKDNATALLLCNTNTAQFECAKMLIDAGVNLEERLIEENSYSPKYPTALRLAVINQAWETVDLLIEKGASLAILQEPCKEQTHGTTDFFENCRYVGIEYYPDRHDEDRINALEKYCKERRWGQSTVEEEKEDDSNKGYPAINVRVFKDENGEKDVETQKLVSQYMMNWQEETEEYNGRMGITARIPDFFQEINKSCPKWSEQEIENICNYIEKYKVIPTLRYAPEEFDFYTKQVWWLAPFVLLNTNTGEIASWLFIDKNGFYAAHPSDSDGALIFNWDIITDIDIDYEDNLVMLSLTGEHNDNEITQTFTEFVSEGNGSYLSVIPKIYEAYKKTIEVSDNTWFHGAGGEGYESFDSPKELLNEEKWKAVKPTNPAMYGYAPPKIESEKNGEQIKYESGISYQGEAKGEEGSRIPHGRGVMTVPNGPVITGDFKEGLADGHAKMDFLDGEVYEGEWKENKKHGKGTYALANGDKYEGEYQKGEEHGHGIFTWSKGESWVGEWENGKKDGVGTYNYSDGAKFTSDWSEGEWWNVIMGDALDDSGNFIEEAKSSKYISSRKFVFYGKYNDDKQRTVDGTITTPDGVEINLKDGEKYKDKNLTDAYAAMKNKYGSHTFEYNDTDNGILSFERVSEIFGDCTNEEELSYEMDRLYALKINNHEGYVILQADDDEIKEALEKERDIESNVIIKSDNIEFIELLVEMLKLNNREDNGDQECYYDCEKTSKEEIIEEKKEVNKEFWWDEINDYVISKIKQENESIDEYLGHLQILFIDEWDVEDEVEGAMRYHNKVTFEDLDKLEQWIGKEEVKKWKMDWESLSEEDMKNTHETALYISTEEGYEYLTHLTIDKENFGETFGNKFLESEETPVEEETKDETPLEKTNNKEEVIKEAPVEEVIEEASAKEEVSTKEDVDSIQSFRNFMKEKFPSLKLPKNKPYAGIDLKDGYSINFHVQKKAVVLSFRSVKTDPEKIMGILDEKGLNGKDIGDGHILNAQPGKRNPSIITMNIEITYSSEDELDSDNLRENVRSYFEKFSEIFDFSNQS